MKVKLSDHFTYKKIFRATIAPILMMLFISLYTVVDGLCVANLSHNEYAFAGVNLIFPLIMTIGGLAFMFGCGGCALAGKYLGEKRQEDADRVFSNIVSITFFIGLIISVGGYFMVGPFARSMAAFNEGTAPEVVEQATKYGKILMLGQSFFMLQNIFQNFFVVDEKSGLSFAFSLAAGLTNIVFDLIFVGACQWGVTGAAIATLLGYLVGSIGPIFYFFMKKDNLIHLKFCKINFKDFGKCCYNGISEFISNISLNIVALVFNALLISSYKELGVEAYGIITYVSLFFVSIFIGYNIGMGPIISFHYGAQNNDELRNLLKKSLIIFAISSVVMCLLGIVLATPIAMMFADGDQNLISFTTHAMRVYSIAFLLCGFAMFFSAWFTALNNGFVSGLISFVRLLVLEVGLAFLFNALFGGEGLWWSVPVADLLTCIMCVGLILGYRKKYNY